MPKNKPLKGFLSGFRFGFKSICAFLIIGLPFGFMGQTKTKSSFLDKKATKVLVDSLANQLKKYYVFKDAANRMSLFVQKRCKEGAYDNVSDPHTLAGMLTKDVSSVHLDEHFHVEYNPQIANEISGEIEDVPKFVEEKLKIERDKNFGFKKAELLNGNIGYLEISSFSRLNEYSKKTVDAAFKLLSNASAMIIDLRYGTGGSPDMVNYIISKFFSTKTHIADIYIRSENATLSYWTTPDTIPNTLTGMPLYILTSYKTFSAAEALAYELQSLRRAIVVGEVTRGGAHTVSYRNLSNGFICDIPFGVARSPITKTNWEKIGITPNVMVPEEKALEVAEVKIFENARQNAKDSASLKQIQWQWDLVQSIHHPFAMDSISLKKFSGTYGPYKVFYEKDGLYYQKTGKALFPLLPLSDNLMKVKGNDTFRIEFVRDGKGEFSKIITHYEDGRLEPAERTK